MAAYSFESLLIHPQKLVELLKTDQQVICLSKEASFIEPKQVVIGEKARCEVGKILWKELGQHLSVGLPAMKKIVEDEFQKLNSADIQLFTDLPLTCYPPEHPFLSNSTLVLLKKYQALLYLSTLSTTFIGCADTNEKQTKVVLLGQSISQTVKFDPTSQDGSTIWLEITYSPYSRVSEYLKSQPRNEELYTKYGEKSYAYELAVDQHSNVWILTNTLRNILMGW